MVIRSHAVPIFIAVWVFLALLSAVFFVNRNAQFKRKAWPPVAVLVGVLLAGCGWVGGASLLFAGSAALVITLVSLRRFAFCDACGRTIDTKWPFPSVTLCPKCGAELK
jgi:hypothetical protein